jgi:hypothetical protein
MDIIIRNATLRDRKRIPVDIAREKDKITAVQSKIARENPL